MSATKLYSADLNSTDFIELIKDISWPEHTVLIAFSPVESRFEYYSFVPDFLALTEQGCIFSPEFEFKWRKIDDFFRVLIMGDFPDEMPAGFSNQTGLLADFYPCNKSLFLWGERSDNNCDEWLEQQVPHRFSYPFSGAGRRCRLSLSLQEWSDKHGNVNFSRYLKLVEGE
jgi:hypothetical protein